MHLCCSRDHEKEGPCDPQKLCGSPFGDGTIIGSELDHATCERPAGHRGHHRAETTNIVVKWVPKGHKLRTR